MECRSVGPGPNGHCRRRSDEQHRRPGSDRHREHVREDKRSKGYSRQRRRRPGSVSPRPGLDAPETAGEQDEASQQSRTGGRNDPVADDQRAGRGRRCWYQAHSMQRSAVFATHERAPTRRLGGSPNSLGLRSRPCWRQHRRWSCWRLVLDVRFGFGVRGARFHHQLQNGFAGAGRRARVFDWC